MQCNVLLTRQACILCNSVAAKSAGGASLCSVHMYVMHGRHSSRLHVAQEAQAAKGSQGAGKVDESLDRSRASADLDAAPSKPALPAGQGKKKKGRN